MPRHDMECRACKFKFEISKPMAAEMPKVCPECKEPEARQVFNAPPAYHNHMSPMNPRRTRGRGY